jgi:hypothetical protein
VLMSNTIKLLPMEGRGTHQVARRISRTRLSAFAESVSTFDLIAPSFAVKMSSKSSLPQSRAFVQHVLTGNISIRDLCGGSGIVASDAAARYRKGHALREHRVRTLGLTQKQLAEPVSRRRE